MKNFGALRNSAIALGIFILWGNLVSLMLPAEEYGMIAKTVDFATVLFLLPFLAAALIGLRKKKGV